MTRLKHILLDPIFGKNPILFQVLGVCSALAVTSSVSVTVAMCIALTTVVALSSFFISCVRHLLPGSVRLIIQMTIIASLVIVADQFLKAYFFDISRILSVFVGLIITNCIVLGRAEAYATQNPPISSFFDGLGNGIGYSCVLLTVAVIREFFGTGGLLGWQILPATAEGGWYAPNMLMLAPASAFFLIATLVWILRSVRPDQQEEADLSIIDLPYDEEEIS